MWGVQIAALKKKEEVVNGEPPDITVITYCKTTYRQASQNGGLIVPHVKHVSTEIPNLGHASS